MTKHDKSADLLKILGQKDLAPKRPDEGAAAPEQGTAPRSAAGSQKKRAKPQAPAVGPSQASHKQPVRGKAVQFYLHEADEKLIRELAVWLLPHRKRINDSLVIKTVLRAAKTGPDLLAAYDAAVKVDGRTRQNRRTRDTTKTT
jgi:hypothetical protein